MNRLCKTLLLTLAVATALSIMGGTAAANSFSISDEDIRVVWEELTLDSGSGEIICEVTLEGSFHETAIAKEEELLGLITSATFNLPGCSGIGDLEANQASLPWHISYLGFEGTLPNIDAVILLLDGITFDILNLPFGVRCQYSGNAQGFAVPTGTDTTLVADESVSIPKTGGSFLCPASQSFRGQAPVTELGSSTDVIIRLI